MLALNRQSIPMRYDPHDSQQVGHRAIARYCHENGHTDTGPIARFAAVSSGRRWGKTQFGAAEMSRRIVWDYRRKMKRVGIWKPSLGSDPEPFLRYAVVAPTYALLNEPKIALQRYLGRVEEGGLIVTQTQNTWWLRGGIRIDFLSGDRPERLVSHAYHGIWLEEAARMKALVWVENLQPTLSTTFGWAIFTSTPLGKNWYWEEVWARADAAAAAELAALQGRQVSEILDDQYAGMQFVTADNTAIPGLAEEMMRAEKQLPRAMFMRNYYASFDAFAGQLFDLVAARHIAADPPPSPFSVRRASIGGDIGYSQQHPSSFTLGIEDAQKRWQEVGTVSRPGILFDVDREWDARDRLEGVHLDRACWTVQVYRMTHGWCGDGWRGVKLYLPSDRPDVERQFRARGFKVEAAYQEHEPAVTFMQGLLHVDRFLFRSQILWRSCQNLRVPAAGTRSNKLWVAEHDDPWDGLRYQLSEPISRGESPVGQSFQAIGWWAR